MTLSVVLSTNALFSASDKKKLKSVVSFLHLSLTSHLAFLQPYDQGWLSEETIICDGVCVHIPSVVDTLEVLRMHLEVSLSVRNRVFGLCHLPPESKFGHSSLVPSHWNLESAKRTLKATGRSRR